VNRGSLALVVLCRLEEWGMRNVKRVVVRWM